jgi:membrane associated rhomboid family serine protease
MTEAVERTCYRHPDRVTGLSCSECGRPICTECMTMAPVGIRCPEHSGRPVGVQRMTHGVRRASFEGVGAKVTRALIGINVAVYIAELATGGGVNGVGSTIYEKGVLIASAFDSHGRLVGVAQGDWWRLITAAFLHYGPFHLLLNMFALFWFGSLLEQRIGSGKFLLLYLVSGLAGSAGALVWSPLVPTVGASGAIFGLLGAAIIVLRSRGINPMESGLVFWLGLNLVFSFTISGISIGGHIGGLVGGTLAAIALYEVGPRLRLPFAASAALVGAVAAGAVAGSIAIAA